MSHGRAGVALLAALLALLCGAGPAAAQEPPRVEARAWALVDARTGEVLTSHAAARRVPIASTTKLMTAYVALQELELGRIVRAAPYEAIYGESLLGLRAGERVSVRDLLHGLLMRSGNDSAEDLALVASGSEAAFVAAMNRRAAALGLADTHYATPSGSTSAATSPAPPTWRPWPGACCGSPPSRASSTRPPRCCAACVRRAKSRTRTTCCGWSRG